MSLRDVARWADALPGRGMDALGPWVESVGTLYPPGWVRLAVAEALSADPRRIKQYAHACLKRWHAVGGPPDLAVAERAERDRRAAASAPTPEPERPELRPLRDPSLGPAVAKLYVPRASRPGRPGVPGG